jgi:hypothetical protein
MLILTSWSSGFILAHMHFAVEIWAVYTLDCSQREARMQEISQEMTVRDALRFLSPGQQINLRPWAEEFGIQLREFHIGHIKTYENLRLRIVPREVVNAEVSTLLGLLDSVGAGEEIRRFYQPLREPDELSSEERASLPERALKYIEKLEHELRELAARNHQTQARISRSETDAK